MVQLSHLLCAASLLATTFAAPATKNATIEWKECPKDIISKLPVQCGNVDVPLDYTDKSAGTVQLNMVKVPAVKKPVKGSILLNFGGPGEEAQSTLGLFGYVLQAMSGGHYDLVAFDPRGTVKTLPFTCYNNTLDLMTYRSYTSIFPEGDDEALLGKLWARGKINAQSCADMQPKNGQLIGTAFTARDIKTVANMLDSDGKIRYWGFSYGTTLGSTLVSMFPDEVDRVVLDGVQNPHEYYNAYADFQEWKQSDDVLAGIFHYCILNADQCPLARHGKTGRELEDKVKQLVKDLRTHPVPLGPIIIDDSLIHLQLASALYSTQTWPLVTTALDLLMDKKYDDKFLGQYLGVKFASDASFLEQSTKVPQSLSGIHCLDRKARTNSYADFAPAIQQLSKSSWAMGGASIALSMNCVQWIMQPKERYGGDFRAKTKTGVLLVGNKYDGHTPIQSAHNVSAGFQGSQVLEIDGYGHASMTLPSACTLEKVSHYWMTGELPKKGTVCGIDAPPFTNVTWDQVIEKSGALKIDKRDTMGHLPATPAMFPWMKKPVW